MQPAEFESAIAQVTAGAWAVGVSGGADSVALLDLLRQRADLSLHVVHLDHETRGEASTGDAAFVADLTRKWNLPCTVARRSEIEPSVPDLPANPSAKYRLIRLALYRKVIAANQLRGVILGHHMDDQAETVFLRLLRSANYSGLAGMTLAAEVGGITILRPMLGLRCHRLREHLTSSGITWREDASNQSDEYLRNRVRPILEQSPQLMQAMLDLSTKCAGLRDWVQTNAPMLATQFSVSQLAYMPKLIAGESARRWLIDQSVPADQIDPAVIDRFLTMVNDAASASRQTFPGSIVVRRRAGAIFVQSK